MKKILYTAITSAALFATSCVDLDLPPSGSINGVQFYQTEADFTAAVNGVYSIMTEWPSGFHGMYNNLSVYMADLTTEYVKAGANTNSMFIRQLSDQNVQPANEFVEAGWTESYIGINRANAVIDRVEESDLSAELKARFANEAKFLRALYYFNLVRWFGAVPLVLHDGDGKEQERTPVDEVYAQIVSDLQGASQLPDVFAGSSEGRATNGAAIALLSKVYLTWAQTDKQVQPSRIARDQSEAAEFYRKSLEYANASINSGKYRLVEDFKDLHNTSKKNGPEHIFSVQHSNLNNVSGHCTFAMGWSNSEPVLMLNVSDTARSSGNVKFYDDFSDADQRKGGSFAKTLWQPAKSEFFTFEIPLFLKYIDTLNFATNQYAGRNMNNAYLRYAEVLLIKAEVENELNGPTAAAYDALNQVRRRAFKAAGAPIPATSEYDLQGLSKEQFREALQRERFFEFVLESHHWFDLVRWHKLVQTVVVDKKGVRTRFYLFPLPESQVQLSNANLTQNWGYIGAEDSPNPYKDYEPGYTDNDAFGN